MFKVCNELLKEKYMIYVTSDWHGYPLAKFMELLDKANFSDDDYCFVLGDVIDRGWKVLSYLSG